MVLKEVKEKPIIFIISHNRYTYLKKLIDRLLRLKQDKIVIVDNKSTYIPLLEFYDEIRSTFDIIYMKENYRARRSMGKVFSEFKDKYNLARDNYIYTDSDVVPDEECPEDFVEVFSMILQKYHVEKVAFGLRIDNLPDCFAGKNFIIKQQKYRWESPFIKDFGIELKQGGTDTTFSYRRANTIPGLTGNSIRTGRPYVANHLPWYMDSDNLSEEEKYYFKTSSSNFSTFMRDMNRKWR